MCVGCFHEVEADLPTRGGWKRALTPVPGLLLVALVGLAFADHAHPWWGRNAWTTAFWSGVVSTLLGIVPPLGATASLGSRRRRAELVDEDRGWVLADLLDGWCVVAGTFTAVAGWTTMVGMLAS